MNWKYLLYDVFKVVVPILAVAYLPEGAPDAEIITVALYVLASVLGIDAIQKTVRSLLSQ